MENASWRWLRTAQTKPLSYLVLFLQSPHSNYSLKFLLPLTRSNHILCADKAHTKKCRNTGGMLSHRLSLWGCPREHPVVSRGFRVIQEATEDSVSDPCACPTSLFAVKSWTQTLKRTKKLSSTMEWLPEKCLPAGSQTPIWQGKEDYQPAGKVGYRQRKQTSSLGVFWDGLRTI